MFPKLDGRVQNLPISRDSGNDHAGVLHSRPESKRPGTGTLVRLQAVLMQKVPLDAPLDS